MMKQIFTRLKLIWEQDRVTAAKRHVVGLMVLLFMAGGVSLTGAQTGKPEAEPLPEVRLTVMPEQPPQAPQPANSPDDDAPQVAAGTVSVPYSLHLLPSCDVDALVRSLAHFEGSDSGQTLPLKVGNVLQILAKAEDMDEITHSSCVEKVHRGWKNQHEQSAGASQEILDVRSEYESDRKSIDTLWELKSRTMGEVVSLDQLNSTESTGSISGTVTAEDGGTPLAGIEVRVYADAGSFWMWHGTGTTDHNGQYQIDGVSPGINRVGFFDAANGDYVTEYYNGAQDVDNGTDVVVTEGVNTPNIDAALAEAGHINGFVTSEASGTPLQNIDVTAYVFDGSIWTNVWSDYTDVSGFYDIGTLSTGTYRIGFFDGQNGDYLAEFYDNAPDRDSATDIGVVGGEIASGKDATLSTAGHITGRVTNEADGAPLSDIYVSAYIFDGNTWDYFDFSLTDGDGNYDVGRLVPGTYRIRFSDLWNVQYVTEYYHNALSVYSATDIIVGLGDIVLDIDAAMSEPAHVTGTVTDDVSGTAIEGIYVEARRFYGSYWEYVGESYTDINGDYDIGGLMAGTYRIGFFDWSNGDYFYEYYNNAADVESATDVVVPAAGIVSSIDAALIPAAHIKGKVTAENGGAPLQYIGVEAYRFNGNYWEYINDRSTDINGDYDIGGLPAGTYRVGFFDWNNNYYKEEYFDNSPDLANATDIIVPEAGTVTDIDAALSDGGHITGYVTSESDGSPLYDISACAYFDNGNYFEYVNCVYTDSNGHYDIGALPSGDFRVRFRDWMGEYAFEFYDDAVNIYSATDVAVTSGSITSGINAQLGAGGYITGYVTAEDGGTPLPYIDVEVYYHNGNYWQYITYGYTDVNGFYDAGGLRSGYYRLKFVDYDEVYEIEYYDDAPRLDSADSIWVDAGTTTSGIDAALSLPGYISGTVTDADSGLGIDGIYVYAYRFNGLGWDYAGYTTTYGGGYYYTNLLPGSYRVRFWDGSAYYAVAYYNGEHTLDAATDVDVPADSAATEIDAVLDVAGSISGRVTDEADGLPLANKDVRAFRFNGVDWEYTLSDWTDSNGDFTILRLPAGTYRIEYYDWYGPYLTEFFDNAADVDSADDIAVSEGIDSPDVDAALALPVPPDHDDFDAARTVAPLPYRDVVDVIAATTAGDDPGLPCGPGDQGYGSVWYSFTPTTDGWLTADTFGSSYNTVLAVWDGSRGSLNNLDCNDDSGGLQSQVVDLEMSGGTTYFIEIAGYSSDLGELVLNVDFGSPFTACASNTGSDASIAIPDTAPVIGLTLETGDELALYTPDGSICAGHGIWTGNSLGLTAWGDNSQTAAVDGFTSGEEMKFRIWDLSSGVLYDNVVVTYGQGDGLYAADSIHVVAVLDVETVVTQEIPLSAGWNMISSAIDPADPALESLLADIEDDMVLMKNGAGEVYWPSLPANSIGDWDIRHGYQIYMTNSATQRIIGIPVDPAQTLIDLQPGWSLIAYSYDSPMPVDQALAEIIGNVVLVKNGAGQVYWPAYNVDQIGLMRPGEGYQLFVSQPQAPISPRD